LEATQVTLSKCYHDWKNGTLYMTTSENQRLTPTRRANIRLLTNGDGASSRLAECMSISKGPIAAVRAESDKAIGYDFCRKIEAAIGLPDRWLDTPKNDKDVPDAVKSMLRKTARGSSRMRQAFEDAGLPEQRGRLTKLSLNPMMSDAEIASQVREAMLQGGWFAVVCDQEPESKKQPNAPKKLAL
jgi:hypothetical protein